MRLNLSLFLTVLLVFICCIGAASAAEDINNDTLTTDNEVAVMEHVDDVDLQADSSEDTTLESNNAENEIVSASTVSTWADLKTKAETSGAGQTINLASGQTITIGNQISFKNSATIIGSSGTVITGSSSTIPFVSNNRAYSITFKDVTFKDINCKMLMQMQTNGITILDGCKFINITTGSDHDSVVYNNWGTMNVTGCTFANCTTGYGVITNYNWMSKTAVILNVKDTIFENNYACWEPGAINNCAKLTVYNSTFNNNSAFWWAGAIHTHSGANTIIDESRFNNNNAGWNGGALFTYSVLKVYNSNFTENYCNTSAGGGAIGAYNYGSTYDIIIDNCIFKRNHNDNGNGGAIATLNGGYLNVYNSTFINNWAANGLAICAANEQIVNGTGDRGYLVIEGNTFINNTGDTDTVVINGIINSFKNNDFSQNNTQNTHYGDSTNIYPEDNSANIEPLLGSANIENVLSDWDLYNAPVYYYYFPSYGEWTVASDGDIENFYLYAYDPMVLSFENGRYTTTIYFDMDSGAPGVVMYNAPYAIVGKGDNVIFACEGGYNINSGYVNPSDAMFEVQPQGQDGQTYKAYSIYAVVSHTNIIFDCDVTVGSKNFEFTNCTFKKSLTVNSCDWDVDNTLKINATFKNCTFEFDKNQVTSDAKVNLIFDDDCKFPINTVDSEVSISNETNVIIVTLNDAEGNPIKGATVTYNTTLGIEGSNVTGADGKFNITGLTGEFTINVTYAGNESYNPSNKSASFNFKLPAVKTTLTINSTEKGIVVITVVDNENKPIANLEVKYSINGANSTNTTGTDGTISIPVTGEGEIKAYFEGNESYLKSEGSYKYNFTETTPAGNGTSGNGTSGNGTSTNTGKTTTNTHKVTKKATKITAKKATFKAKKKTKKYTIVLKAGKTAVKKVKVTLKVGKKTYKATTNSKGKATFKITKLNKKGKYTAVIKFKGNKNFKATTKKVKITVKK